MHYRPVAARLSGLRTALAPKELEYKVVFPGSKSEDPEMQHLSFCLDWYRQDPSYRWFLQIISDFMDAHPDLAGSLETAWASDARKQPPAPRQPLTFGSAPHGSAIG